MALHYCSLHQRLFSRRCQRWVGFSPATITEIRGYYDLLCSTNRDTSFLHVIELSASITGSATLCFSRWTERRGCQLHRFQYRRKHRAGFLTKKALRCRRPVRPGEEKVVNGGEALSLAWQIESSELMAA